ncbi:MAG: copper amine oxidase N-terminal domain-containing protein [Defluviitaleaceae bacterium]|nr:copper amine oxidase N-terminal domain-containing protein [Defluviitaleaceae bacterium]
MTKNIKKRLTAMVLGLMVLIVAIPVMPVSANVQGISPQIWINGDILEFNVGAPNVNINLFIDGALSWWTTSSTSGVGSVNLRAALGFNVVTNHWIHITASNHTGTSLSSNQVMWNTDGTGATGQTPAGLHVDTTNVLRWNVVPGATSYEISVTQNHHLVSEQLSFTNSLHTSQFGLQHLAGTQVVISIVAVGPGWRSNSSIPITWVIPFNNQPPDQNLPPGQLATPQISINSNGILTWGGSWRRVRIYSDGFMVWDTSTEISSLNLHQIGLFPGTQTIQIRHVHPTNPALSSHLSNAVIFGTAGAGHLPTPNININHNTGVLTWVGGGMRWVGVYVDGAPFYSTELPVSSVNLRDIGLDTGTHPIRIRFLHETNPNINSPLSNTINFNAAGAAMSTPSITINQNTGRLTWSGGGNRHVRVYAGGEPVWTSVGNVNHVDLLSINLPPGSQPIRIRHLHASNEQLHSSLSNTINFNAAGRSLATPSISINNTTGIMTWGGASRSVAVYSGGTRAWTSVAAVTQVDLNAIGLNTGNQSIRLRHLHDTDASLNSNLSNTISFNVTTPPSLPTPTINIDNEGMLRWTGGAGRLVRVYSGGVAVWVSPAVTTQVNLRQIGLGYGNHNIQLRHIHDVNANFNSALSNTVAFNHTPAANPMNTTFIHQQVENALNQRPAGATTATVVLPSGGNGLRINGTTLALAEGAGTSLTFTQDSISITLSPAVMAEMRQLIPGEIRIYIEPRSGGMSSFRLAIEGGAANLQEFNNPITVTTPINAGGVSNFHRIVAVDGLNRPAGGRFNAATGQFVLNTQRAGIFTIAHVDNLTRLNIQLESHQITDLAGNAPTQNMDVLPQIIGGRTMVPVRFIAYALGAGIDFTDATATTPLTVHLSLGGQTLNIPVGETSHHLQNLGMDVPAQIINGRTMVPLRFISEFFGAHVDWDNATRSIEVVR